MKKIIVSVFLFILLISLGGCGVNEEKLLEQYIEKIAVQEEAVENFYLPTSVDGKDDHSISWQSSNVESIRIGNIANIEGVNYYIANVTRSDEDVEVKLTAVVELASGLFKEIEFNVKVIKEEKEKIDCITVAEAISNKLNSVVKVRGVVSGFHYGTYDGEVSVQGCYITDDTGTVYVYGYILAQSVQKGDDIALEATVSEYKTFKQLSEPTLLENYSSNNNISSKGAVADKTLAQIAGDLNTDYTAKAYVFSNVTIKKIDGGSYINYVVDDKNGNSINLYSSGNSSEFSWLDQYAGKEVKILFAINSKNSKGTKWRGHVLDVLEVIGDWTETGSTPSNPSVPTEDNCYDGYATTIEAGIAYKFGLYQGNEKKMYYLTGEMNGYYGATTTDFNSARDVYFEKVDGGYYVYFTKNDKKTYITITVNDTHYNITFADESSVVWVFDEVNNTIKCTIGDKDIYLGTYGNYKTFGGCDYSKISGSYAGRFYRERPTGSSEQPDVVNPNLPEGQCDASITFEDTSNRTAFSGQGQVWESSGIKVTNNIHESQNPVADYVNPVRFYANTNLKIEYTENIKTIVITTNGRCYTGSETLNGATVVVSNGVMIITLDTPATSFTIDKLVSQIRVSKIEIFTAE